MAERVQDEPFDEEVVLNWRQSILLVVSTVFFCAYLFVVPFREWFNLQWSIIVTDWDVLFSIIMILVLTVGWYFIGLIALGVVYFHMKIGKFFEKRLINKIRLVTGLYFFAVLGAHFFFGYSLSNVGLWIIAFFIAFTTGFFINRIVKKVRKSDIGSQDEGWHSFGKPVKDRLRINILYLILILFGGVSLVFVLWQDYYGSWTFLTFIWGLIHSHFGLTLLFYGMVFFWILWRPLVILGAVLYWVVYRLLTKSTRRWINRTRLYLVLFVVIMLVVGNLPLIGSVFNIDKGAQSIIGVLIGFVGTIVAGLALRRFRPMN